MIPGVTEQLPDKEAAGGGVCGDLAWQDVDEDAEDEGVIVDVPDDLSRLAFEGDHVLVVDGDGVTVGVAPDGGWGWMIVFVSFLCASVVDGLCCVFGVMLPDLVMYFDQSSSTVAVAGSLLAGGFLLYGNGMTLLLYSSQILCHLDPNTYLSLTLMVLYV